MNIQNNSKRRRAGLRGFYTFSCPFSFLFFLSVLFMLILFSPAASASLSSAPQFSTAAALSSVPRFSAAAQDFIPENASNKTTSLSIVVLNGEDLYVHSGGYHTFYQGYRLHVKGTSTEGKRVWLELSLGDETLKDLIATEGSCFVYTKNSEILNLTVDTIYAGTEGVLVRFSPVYQYLDPQLPRPVEREDPKLIFPLDPSQPLEFENNRKEGFSSSLSLIVFLIAVLLMGLFTGINRKK